MDDAGLTGAVRAAAQRGTAAVGQHQVRVRERSANVARSGRLVVDIVAVNRDHQPAPRRGAADRVPRRHGVMRVDQVLRKAPTDSSERTGGGRSRPRSPGVVAPGPGWGEVAHVLDLDSVEFRRRGLADRLPGRRQIALAQAGEGRNRPMQHEHTNLGTRVPGGECLAVGPHAAGRVGGTRVVLGQNEDLHRDRQLRWAARVRCASAAGVYGRPARNSAPRRSPLHVRRRRRSAAGRGGSRSRRRRRSANRARGRCADQ